MDNKALGRIDYFTDNYCRTDIELRNIKRDILAAKVEDLRIFFNEFYPNFAAVQCLTKLAEIQMWGVKAIEIGL